jgi:hypothetical protein
MTTSLDTNIVVSLLNQDAAINLQVERALIAARGRGPLAVCGPVYAESLGLPARTTASLDSFFTSCQIEIEWDLGEPLWRLAGLAFQHYVARRKASSGTLPRRILTDFLIGAHAQLRGYTLLTLDQRLYRAAFPALALAGI